MRCCVLVALLVAPAQAAETWRFDLGLTFTRFEQQVKSEIGGARGERVLEETRFGVNALASYALFTGEEDEWAISLGAFAWFDVGSRSAGRFVGLDADNAAVVEGEVGGDFRELWVGPMLRGRWRAFFLELGYGALGLRDDEARDDLPTTGGATGAALRTSPTVAWRFALGGQIPLVDPLQLALRLEYRVRYYDRRDEALTDELVHGTQEYAPFVGISWPL